MSEHAAYVAELFGVPVSHLLTQEPVANHVDKSEDLIVLLEAREYLTWLDTGTWSLREWRERIAHDDYDAALEAHREHHGAHAQTALAVDAAARVAADAIEEVLHRSARPSATVRRLIGEANEALLQVRMAARSDIGASVIFGGLLDPPAEEEQRP